MTSPHSSADSGGCCQDVSKTATHIGTDSYLSTTGTAFGPRTEFARSTPFLDFDDFLPEVGIQWDVNDNFMLCAKYNGSPAGLPSKSPFGRPDFFVTTQKS